MAENEDLIYSPPEEHPAVRQLVVDINKLLLEAQKSGMSITGAVGAIAMNIGMILASSYGADVKKRMQTMMAIDQTALDYAEKLAPEVERARKEYPGERIALGI